MKILHHHYGHSSDIEHQGNEQGCWLSTSDMGNMYNLVPGTCTGARYVFTVPHACPNPNSNKGNYT